MSFTNFLSSFYEVYLKNTRGKRNRRPIRGHANNYPRTKRYPNDHYPRSSDRNIRGNRGGTRGRYDYKQHSDQSFNRSSSNTANKRDIESVLEIPNYEEFTDVGDDHEEVRSRDDQYQHDERRQIDEDKHTDLSMYCEQSSSQSKGPCNHQEDTQTKDSTQKIVNQTAKVDNPEETGKNMTQIIDSPKQCTEIEKVDDTSVINTNQQNKSPNMTNPLVQDADVQAIRELIEEGKKAATQRRVTYRNKRPIDEMIITSKKSK